LNLKKKVTIGITGGLATGKTMLADMLVANGAVKIDVDRLAHELLADETIKKAIVARFGRGILSGERVDRDKLRGVVFSDGVKLEELNRIMHPTLIGKLREKLDAFHASGEGVLVVDAALIIEKGLAGMFDLVVVVKCDEDIQIRRALERGIPEKEARGMIAGQMPFDQKAKLADHVIDNSGSMENLKKGAEKLWKEIQNL
jgi:dephospho-CoA kinase